MAALRPAPVQVAALRVAPDVLHRDMPEIRRDPHLRVDAIVQGTLGLPLDMDDGEGSLLDQILVVPLGVVAPVGHHRRRSEPRMQGLGQIDDAGELRRVVALARRGEVGQRDAVVGVGYHVDLGPGGYLWRFYKGHRQAMNAQAMVSPLDPAKATRSGMLITGADVVNSASDTAQLVPMLEKSEETTGVRVPITLADGGYHTAANLLASERRGDVLVMPERYHAGVQGPYFKDRFVYDAATDSYLCPQGQWLPFRGIRKANGKIPGPYRVYRASRTVCRACPAYGVCTKDAHAGRALWIGPTDTLLRKHRQWMTTDMARRWYARRKELSEPTFGILKEQMGARRFLLRGLANVRGEFLLLATAFNLRTLWRVWTVWQGPLLSPRGALTSVAAQ